LRKGQNEQETYILLIKEAIVSKPFRLNLQKSENEEKLDHKVAEICRDKICDTVPLFTLTHRKFFAPDFSVG
jgi:hypothetical protein